MPYNFVKSIGKLSRLYLTKCPCLQRETVTPGLGLAIIFRFLGWFGEWEHGLAILSKGIELNPATRAGFT